MRWCNSGSGLGGGGELVVANDCGVGNGDGGGGAMVLVATMTKSVCD